MWLGRSLGLPGLAPLTNCRLRLLGYGVLSRAFGYGPRRGAPCPTRTAAFEGRDPKFGCMRCWNGQLTCY